MIPTYQGAHNRIPFHRRCVPLRHREGGGVSKSNKAGQTITLSLAVFFFLHSLSYSQFANRPWWEEDTMGPGLLHDERTSFLPICLFLFDHLTVQIKSLRRMFPSLMPGYFCSLICLPPFSPPIRLTPGAIDFFRRLRIRDFIPPTICVALPTTWKK